MRRFVPFALVAIIPLTLLSAFSVPVYYLFDPLMLPLQAFLLALVFYQIGIAAFGFRRPRPVAAERPRSRFAVLIAAHNEEDVIAQLVSSMRHQDYPADLFSVFVIADNCADRTADVARAAGAVVHERFDTARRGKGPAIEWMLQRLWASDESYDAITIFDADNVVSPNFLRVMDAHLQRGDRVVQGYLGTKNPTDSWVTRAIYTDYVYTNRFFQWAKDAAGLSASLGGTGLCIAMPLLQRLGWRCDSLTEDLEFQMRAILAGVRPTWAHDAVVYDEKPLALKAAWRQRKRWMQGHASVAVRYVAPLFARAIRRRDPVAFDAALYLGSPMWYAFALVGGLVQLGNVLTPLYAFLYPMWLSLGLIAVSYALPYVALRAERLPAHVYLWPSTLAGRFVLGMCWAPLSVLGLLQYRNRHWDKTTHTRGLTLAEAQSQVTALQRRGTPKRGPRRWAVAAAAGVAASLAIVGTGAPDIIAKRLWLPFDEYASLLLDGDTHRAHERLRDAREERPEDAVVQGFMVLADRVAGSAPPELRRLLAAEPQPDEVFVKMAEVLLRLRAHPNGMWLVHELTRMQYGAEAQGFARAAGAFLERKRYDEAAAMLAVGRARLGPEATLLRAEAQLFLSMKSPDKAIRVLEEASRVAPRDADFAAKLGAAHAQAGQWGSALRAWDRALALDPLNLAVLADRDAVWQSKLWGTLQGR